MGHGRSSGRFSFDVEIWMFKRKLTRILLIEQGCYIIFFLYKHCQVDAILGIVRLVPLVGVEGFMSHAAQRSNLATRGYPIVKHNIDSQAYIVKRITASGEIGTLWQGYEISS